MKLDKENAPRAECPVSWHRARSARPSGHLKPKQHSQLRFKHSQRKVFRNFRPKFFVVKNNSTTPIVAQKQLLMLGKSTHPEWCSSTEKCKVQGKSRVFFRPDRLRYRSSAPQSEPESEVQFSQQINAHTKSDGTSKTSETRNKRAVMTRDLYCPHSTKTGQ